jgi:hypothetical protein
MTKTRTLSHAQFVEWLETLSDRSIMTLYEKHCGSCDDAIEPKTFKRDEAIWFEAFNRFLIGG